MTRRHQIGLVLVILAAAFAVSASPAEPLRDFGYFIGDVLTQRVPLHTDDGNFELAEPLQNERVGRWLQRLSSTSLIDEEGRNWLLIDYQIINSPREPVTVALPDLQLEVVDGEPLEIRSMPFSISPLTPAAILGEDGLPMIRPDREPTPPKSGEAVKRLQVSGIALVVTLAAWLGWWLWRLYAGSEQAPFAAALRRLRSLDAMHLDDNPDAWTALHRAFNSTAGRSVTGSNIDFLIGQAPWLASRQQRIGEFFEISAARFFAQNPQPSPFALLEFARELYRAEKRHADSLQQRKHRGTSR